MTTIPYFGLVPQMLLQSDLIFTAPRPLLIDVFPDVVHVSVFERNRAVSSAFDRCGAV